MINALRAKIIDLESELSTVRRRTEVAMYDISNKIVFFQFFLVSSGLLRCVKLCSVGLG